MPESQGQNLALTLPYVPYSLDSGTGLKCLFFRQMLRQTSSSFVRLRAGFACVDHETIENITQFGSNEHSKLTAVEPTRHNSLGQVLSAAMFQANVCILFLVVPFSLGSGSKPHPGGKPGANLKSISHRCHPILVAFVWELTKETINMPLGCLQGGLNRKFSKRIPAGGR